MLANTHALTLLAAPLQVRFDLTARIRPFDPYVVLGAVSAQREYPYFGGRFDSGERAYSRHQVEFERRTARERNLQSREIQIRDHEAGAPESRIHREQVAETPGKQQRADLQYQRERADCVETIYPNHYKSDIVRKGRDSVVPWDIDVARGTCASPQAAR